MIKYSIEDEVHAEWQADFATFDEALQELVRRSKLPWDKEPNQCPCMGWETCERIYTITKFEVNDSSYTPLDEQEVLTVSAKGIFWSKGYEKYAN